MWTILPSKINGMDREKGYYWIRFQDEEYEIAFWDGNSWNITGNSDIWNDKDFQNIDENPIKKYKR